jgi:pimeloyl-ACP methyl ester carboxylesterase
VGRIAVIETLARVGVDWLDGAEVLGFQMPRAQRDGYETLSYTYRMMMALAPPDWRESLSAASAPVLILAGRDDEAMRPQGYARTVGPAVGAEVALIGGAGHLGLVTDDRALDRLSAFLTSVGDPS